MISVGSSTRPLTAAMSGWCEGGGCPASTARDAAGLRTTLRTPLQPRGGKNQLAPLPLWGVPAPPPIRPVRWRKVRYPLVPCGKRVGVRGPD
jgi:hypothetical protein